MHWAFWQWSSVSLTESLSAVHNLRLVRLHWSTISCCKSPWNWPNWMPKKTLKIYLVMLWQNEKTSKKISFCFHLHSLLLRRTHHALYCADLNVCRGIFFIRLWNFTARDKRWVWMNPLAACSPACVYPQQIIGYFCRCWLARWQTEELLALFCTYLERI